MAAVCILDEFEVHKNEKFLKIAEKLKPELYEIYINPKKLLKFEKHLKVERKPDMNQIEILEEDFEKLPEKKFKRDDQIVLDFGDHQVGYVTLDLSSAGSHQDAPAYLYLRFAERLEELGADPAEYDGWISKSWLQEEYIHVDVLPTRLCLPRRYAFRYMEIKVIDVSMKYSLVINDVQVKAVSAVSADQIPPLKMKDPLFRKIDRVAIRTLQNCMQDVFEDGPKRDRRLWIGDFRLQARANYLTFKNYNLVKRCLYLFGGMIFNEGKISACLFTEPLPEPDDTYLFDFALLYGSALLDYYEETGDRDTLRDLYPVAIRQIEIGLDYLNEDGVIPDRSSEFWCFVDWGEGLNTQAASLAVLIYSLRYGVRLARFYIDGILKGEMLIVQRPEVTDPPGRGYFSLKMENTSEQDGTYPDAVDEIKLFEKELSLAEIRSECALIGLQFLNANPTGTEGGRVQKIGRDGRRGRSRSSLSENEKFRHYCLSLLMVSLQCNNLILDIAKCKWQGEEEKNAFLLFPPPENLFFPLF